MTSFLLKLMSLGTFLLFLSFETSYSSETEEKKPKEDPSCKEKRLTVRGRPNKAASLAHMNAVVDWIRLAKKQGDEYSDWFYAKKSKISCGRLSKTDYFLCIAAGIPCLRPKPKNQQDE